MSEIKKEVAELFMTVGTTEKLPNGRFMRNKGPGTLRIIVQKTSGSKKLHPEKFKPNIFAKFMNGKLEVHSIKQQGKKTRYGFYDAEDRYQIVDFDVVEVLKKHPDFPRKYNVKKFIVVDPDIIEYEDDAPIKVMKPAKE